MIHGVVLYFSPCGKVAHFWCVLNDAPLCVAYEEDFPDQWPALQIGTRVELRIEPDGDLMRVSDLKFQAFDRAAGT